MTQRKTVTVVEVDFWQKGELNCVFYIYQIQNFLRQGGFAPCTPPKGHSHGFSLHKSCVSFWFVTKTEWNCHLKPITFKLFLFFLQPPSKELIMFVRVLMAHNWKKWKRVFLTCPCHKIYRDEAVGLKSFKYTLEIMIYVSIWGNFLKFDILSITAELKFESENSFAHVWHI